MCENGVCYMAHSSGFPPATFLYFFNRTFFAALSNPAENAMVWILKTKPKSFCFYRKANNTETKTHSEGLLTLLGPSI